MLSKTGSGDELMAGGPKVLVDGGTAVTGVRLLEATSAVATPTGAHDGIRVGKKVGKSVSLPSLRREKKDLR